MPPAPGHESVTSKPDTLLLFTLQEPWEALNERNGSLKLLVHLVHVVCVFLTCVFSFRLYMTNVLFSATNKEKNVGIHLKQKGKGVIHESKDSKDWIMEMLCDL